MELTLSARIILKYYKTKLQLLERLSPEKAAAAALQLFFTPFANQRKLERPAIFHKAEKLSFVFEGNTIKGFRWLSPTPNARIILVCHGMNSCSYRFEKYVQLLAQHHFTVLAFDAQAHGQSEGKILNAVVYADLILQIENTYGPVYGIIAHSVAGLATSFAAEQWGQTNKKIVLIAPATETVTAIDNFFMMLHLKPSFRAVFDAMVKKQRGHLPAWYSAARAIQHTTAKTLWIHDEHDKICPYKDALAVKNMQLPHVNFITTRKLGHNKIYRDATVQHTIMEFLLAP